MHRDLENAVAALRSPNQNFVSTREALKKLLVLDNQGVDIQSSVNYVVRVLPMQDHVIKKLACNLISRLSSRESGAGLLVHNTLGNELRDPNPAVRALSLRTMCECCHEAEDALGAVATALDDDSPYVRRAAVLACVRLARRSDSGSGCSDTLVNRLYAALRDVDPLVVGNALAALDQVLGAEGGAVINRNIARHLASRLSSLDEWSVGHALSALARHTPPDDEHLFRLLDAIDPFLRHANCSVAVAATRLFLHLLTTTSTSTGLTRDLRPDVYHRALPRMATALADAAHPELVRLVLQFVREQLDEFNSAPVPAAVFAPLANSLLCKYGEADDIKVDKIRLLAEVVAPDSLRVLDEIAMYCTSASPRVSRAAIEAVGRVAARSEATPTIFQLCATRLLALLTLERTEVSACVLSVLRTLELSRASDRAGLASSLSECARRMVVSDEGALSLVWLMGEWGGHIDDAPYILERFAEELRPELDGRVKLNLIEATIKLFFCRPAECQPVLGRLLERCWSDGDPEVRRSAVYYYRLLGHDVQLARRIVAAAVP